MCERFIEGQKDCRLETGDFYYNPESKSVHIVKLATKKEICPNPKLWRVKLFRQDQLQGMIVNWRKNFRLGFSENGLAVSNPYGELQYFIEGISMEQLWLAFVMKEKFNKTWNGEDWLP